VGRSRETEWPKDLGEPRFLILRLSAIGDVILSIPVLCALRERFPQAYICWVVEPASRSLLEGHPDLDRLIVIPKKWLRSPRSFFWIRAELRPTEFDVAFDIQGLTKTATIGWLAGVRRQVTYGTRDAREISPWLATDLVYPTRVHVVERNLELLRVVGIHEPRPRFRFPGWPEAGHRAKELLASLDLPERGFGIINPGAGWPSKLWPPERFGLVSRYWGEHWRLPSLVVWAGSKERCLAEQVVARSGGWARLAPNTSLTELAELSRRARLFLSSDTGPLHLAAALGTPCVGLYGPWPADRCGPYGDHCLAIQKMRLDAPSHRRRKAPPIYMDSIGVDDVCTACDTLLARQAPPLAA